MFGLFKKHNFSENPDKLIEEIIRLLKIKKMNELISLCNENHVIIKANFKTWAKVPDSIRASPDMLEPYANALITIADMFRQIGDESLIKVLQGDGATNPIEIWQEKLTQAKTMSESGSFTESKNILLETIAELEQSTGNAKASLLPKAYGHLGVVLFNIGDIEGAISNTNNSLCLCRETGDLEGIAAYSGNLVEIMIHTGIEEKGHHLIKERIDALQQIGRINEAKEYAAKYNA